ncbi:MULTISPECIES: glycine betaine ABC transporter substrate-binding protein OsmF [Marinobacter]|uniref:glycine betaine ABC transporter substrate-binding protein OsmF n=1 Tax=Marinobacter TaxID=2742 RepID=UPI000948BCD4|nr:MULTISPECIES: ABC transporter substrate-binding protein [Marinobacter]MDC8454989.1 ABC transporter substrate-binding protein [Marinobacter sp. DS40M6]MDM8180347.1 ABC transporter substrate-binding protein [Marinobacter salarius]OLF83294.1 osmoprotectant uptake system substrate-binding protein [Marinobacter sp. C18]RUT77388.1 ABC transporter substrate-binding protein [Marinobacter sp. NP-6]
MIAGPAMAADPVVVSSKIDTEGAVLGQMILQTLEEANIPVENRLQLGATSIVRNAIKAGEIDLYPEYTGNAAFFHDQADRDIWKDAAKAYEQAASLDKKAHNIVWLTPAKANNTWAMSVRGDLARENGLNTLEDLASYINGGGAFKFAASAEFVESASALPAFQEAYGFKLGSDQLLILSGGNTAATLRAAALTDNDVNGAMTYGTDGGLNALDLKVMEDTLGVQPVYQPAPIVRAEVLETYPNIREVLAPVFESLDLETLQRLNGQVAVNGVPAEAVARDYLDSLAQD